MRDVKPKMVVAGATQELVPRKELLTQIQHVKAFGLIECLYFVIVNSDETRSNLILSSLSHHL